MVDFNAEATVSASAVDILRILILQRRNDVIDSIEAYHKVESHSSDPDISIVRSRVMSLFIEIQAMLKRKLNNKEKGKDNTAYDVLEEKVKCEKFDDLYSAFLIMNEFLDDNRLIRIDTKQVYDSTRVSSEDKEKGL